MMITGEDTDTSPDDIFINMVGVDASIMTGGGDDKLESLEILGNGIISTGPGLDIIRLEVIGACIDNPCGWIHKSHSS